MLIATAEVAERLTHRSRGTRTACRSTLVATPPAGPGWLHEMKHMPHGARVSFALVSLREYATFVGGRYIALKAARILVNTLHFNRSASTFEDLDRISASRLPFVHVADAPVQASYTTEGLLHAGRVERLPPGEGGIDIKRILSHVPQDIPWRWRRR